MRMAFKSIFKKWQKRMPDDDKKPRHPETNFLPPLDMILSFFKKKKNDEKDIAKNKPAETADEKVVEKIIEKLNKDK